MSPLKLSVATAPKRSPTPLAHPGSGGPSIDYKSHDPQTNKQAENEKKVVRYLSPRPLCQSATKFQLPHCQKDPYYFFFFLSHLTLIFE